VPAAVGAGPADVFLLWLRNGTWPFLLLASRFKLPGNVEVLTHLFFFLHGHPVATG